MHKLNRLCVPAVYNASRHCLMLPSDAGAPDDRVIAQLAEELEEGVIVTVLADDATKYSEVIEQLMP